MAKHGDKMVTISSILLGDSLGKLVTKLGDIEGEPKLLVISAEPDDAFEVDTEEEAAGAARQLWGSPVTYVAEPLFGGYRRPVMSGRMRRITPKTPRLRK